MNIDDISDIYVPDAGAHYKVATLRVFRHFRDYVSNVEGWKEKFSSDTVTVWTKHSDPNGPGAGLNIVRVRALFPNVKPETMYNALHDAPFRKSWDDKMIEGANLVRLDQRNDIGYYSAKFPFPLSNRDFLNQRFWMEFEGEEYIIMNRSVRHTSRPETDDFVRGVSLITGYYLKPLGESGTELLYITHSDIRGNIPHMVLNSGTQRMCPSAMAKLNETSEKYAEWSKANHPADFQPTWRTAKVKWDAGPVVTTLATVPSPPPHLVDEGKDKKKDKDAAAKGGQPGQEQPPEGASAADLVAWLRVQLGKAQAYADPATSLASIAPKNSDDVAATLKHCHAVHAAADAVDRKLVADGATTVTLEEYAALVRTMYATAAEGGA